MVNHVCSDHRSGPCGDGFRSLLLDYVAGLGDGARCAGATAAALHEFDGYSLRPPFHFVTPRNVNRRRIGHHVHTSTVLPPIDCEEVGGIAVTSPTRTLIDPAVTDSPSRLTAALDGAIRDRATTETFLLERIAALRGKGRYGIPKLLAVIEVPNLRELVARGSNDAFSNSSRPQVSRAPPLNPSSAVPVDVTSGSTCTFPARRSWSS